MIFIKSILVGIVTLFIATIAYLICTPYLLLRMYPPPPQTHVSFDVIGLLNRPVFWLIAAAAFALGFYWEFRRAM